MFKAAAILFMYLETPLHAGSGTSLGVVDLPIQREKHTGFPMVQASGVKGAIRAHARDVLPNAEADIALIFGPEGGNSDYASAVGFTDAKLLLFPVRSLAGVFAWTTCPTALNRLRRELAVVNGANLPDIPTPDAEQALVTEQPGVLIDQAVVLEEFTFAGQQHPAVSALSKWLADYALPDSGEYSFWAEHLQKNLVVLSDNAFRDFVQLSTDVVARIRINPDKGTVDSERGGLWYEECLPPESILWTLAMATDPRGSNDGSTVQTATGVLDFVTNRIFGQVSRMQFGGDETIGRGLVNVTGLEGQ
jgi:CRISPR-associated protein Cmr4